jgi:hypothetical protein
VIKEAKGELRKENNNKMLKPLEYEGERESQQVRRVSRISRVSSVSSVSQKSRLALK